MQKQSLKIVFALIFLTFCSFNALAQLAGPVQFKRVTVMGDDAIKGNASSDALGNAALPFESWNQDEDTKSGEHDIQLELSVDSVYAFDFILGANLWAEGAVTTHDLLARIETSEHNPLARVGVDEEDVVGGVIDRAYTSFFPVEMNAWVTGPLEEFGFMVAGAGINGNVTTDYVLEVQSPGTATNAIVVSHFDINVSGDLVDKLNSAYFSRVVGGSFIGAEWNGEVWTIIGLIREDTIAGAGTPKVIFRYESDPELVISELSVQLTNPDASFAVHQTSRYDVSAVAGNMWPGPLQQTASIGFINEVTISGHHD